MRNISQKIIEQPMCVQNYSIHPWREETKRIIKKQKKNFLVISECRCYSQCR